MTQGITRDDLRDGTTNGVRAGAGEPVTYDVLGIGFGPSNLALAIALSEHNEDSDSPVTARFLERQPRFGWHRGMLLEDATMQVSFLKDLVTMRRPTSEFSFLNYLHDNGRLVDFINHKTLFPLRVEFHDYLEWCAAKLPGMVSYDTSVTGLSVIRDGEDVRCVEVHTDAGSYRARHVVFGTGLVPNLPNGITESARVWHNRDLRGRVESLAGTEPKRFVVIGAGQSGAEVTAYLHDQFPGAEVCAVFARYGYSPSDDSPFANRIFDPDAVDAFYEAPEAVKNRLLDYHGNTNYSAVDLELIEDLYRRMYQERVLGKQRLRVCNLAEAQGVRETEDGVRVTIRSLVSGEHTELEADAVVYATGYRPADPSPLLGELEPYCARDEQDRLRVERDYRLRTAPRMRAGLYLQGGTEHTHGITSSLLSNTAVRVGEIRDSLLAALSREPAKAGGR
ncbi:lysine N(6)-hydroxylase/L-ornithine N(5)-oxygenase family protein [Sciscionella sediminilitoris]|uniref:lysine N(6)-hydroxylase/L-ornithine N(5)-oxygenase family protein n=1 Tax=Sciscionella sediminilitoris TaxID=1445613 RepID=UPI000B31664E|nr:lysine N(6)-hydroxylase/L-ornithine N(5)-oxygenase family protein [Sciscionella sp. SE31]